MPLTDIDCCEWRNECLSSNLHRVGRWVPAVLTYLVIIDTLAPDLALASHTLPRQWLKQLGARDHLRARAHHHT